MSTEFMFVQYVEWDIGNGIRKMSSVWFVLEHGRDMCFRDIL